MSEPVQSVPDMPLSEAFKIAQKIERDKIYFEFHDQVARLIGEENI